MSLESGTIYSPTHPVSPSPISSNSTKVKSIYSESCWKIWSVVKIIFQTFIGVFLYWTNSSLFALGFLSGIVFDKHVSRANRKIKDVWDTQPWSVAALGLLGAQLSLPVTVGTVALLWSAQLGAHMYKEAQKIRQKSLVQ